MKVNLYIYKMKRLKQIWFSFWEDDSTPHSKIPPYTMQIIILLFVGGLIYQAVKYLYYLLINR